MITLPGIEAAAQTLNGVIQRTPTLPAPRLSALTGATVFVKYENMQAVGSFKERGAYTRLSGLTAEERAAGVAAMSAGNHAQAVAYHAQNLGIDTTIVMPERTPMVKVAATESFGATVVLAGETLAESATHCADLVAREGRTLIHPYDDADVVRGQGTVALEMLADAPSLDTLIVPIGGGGLISGIAVAAQALKPSIRIIGVEAALYASASAALSGDERPIGGSTIAEGIAVKGIGAVTLPIIKERVSDIIIVDEPQIERAVNLMLTLQKTMAEGAGAAALAALLAKPEMFVGRTVGLVCCGGNIDPRMLASIMVRELARERRIVSLEAHYVDEPGLLATLTGAIGRARANILEVTHNRLALNHLARETTIRLTIETRDDAHTTRVLDEVAKTGLSTRLTDHVDGRF
ncbi:MAG: threonine ammonia-lyase [Pseudomonadota bacterium]